MQLTEYKVVGSWVFFKIEPNLVEPIKEHLVKKGYAPQSVPDLNGKVEIIVRGSPASLGHALANFNEVEKAEPTSEAPKPT